MVGRIIAIFALTCASALISFPLSPTQAKSAFAAGIPDDVADQGVAIGWTGNFATREEAEAGALEKCRANKNSNEAVHALCKVVEHFDNRCFSVAIDPKAGTPGWGWGIADTQSLARDQAMATCRSSAGADRASYCQISTVLCDGAAKQPSGQP